MKRMSKAERKIDELVTSIYGTHCRGQINVLDIGAVFEAGTRCVMALAREAAAAGTVPFDLESCRPAVESAMSAKFAELRKD